MIAERDYLKKELGMFLEHTESLEKEKSALCQELKEKKEMDEFLSLEDKFTKEHEVHFSFYCFYVKQARKTFLSAGSV